MKLQANFEMQHEGKFRDEFFGCTLTSICGNSSSTSSSEPSPPSFPSLSFLLLPSCPHTSSFLNFSFMAVKSKSSVNLATARGSCKKNMHLLHILKYEIWGLQLSPHSTFLMLPTGYNCPIHSALFHGD